MRPLATAMVVLAASVLPPALAASANAQVEDPDLDGVPGLAAPPSEPYAPVPSILTGTGHLLIDRSHGNSFEVNGFTDFLAENGWTVSEFTVGPITETALQGVDVLMVPTRAAGLGAIFPFDPAEVAAVQDCLARGNGLWVLHDNLNPNGVNTLSGAFGVVFQWDYVQDPTNNVADTPFWPDIYELTAHPITSGVESYTYYLGDCLSVSEPATIVGRADEDAYSLYCPVGSRPPTLAVWEASGRAVFSGDITPLAPPYYPELLRPEEQLLLQNIANWLLGPTPTSTEAVSWGRIKGLYK